MQMHWDVSFTLKTQGLRGSSLNITKYAAIG